MDCNPPGSSLHETLQARILEWIAIAFSRGASWPRVRTNRVSCTASGFFTIWITWKFQRLTLEKESWVKNMSIQGKWNSWTGPLQEQLRMKLGPHATAAGKEGDRNSGKSNFQHPHGVDSALEKGVFQLQVYSWSDAVDGHNSRSYWEVIIIPRRMNYSVEICCDPV